MHEFAGLYPAFKRYLRSSDWNTRNFPKNYQASISTAKLPDKLQTEQKKGIYSSLYTPEKISKAVNE
ncbi:Hypothetical predicted protein [Cloeon dipterum]|uniref:Uncharacterized protein n=1 Tax=Cloeon dipterum TaxID=197152 RepID=A0A8S1DKK9_9INSE|nr:Hypothetical predicted protein [Cloeon dipterum]